MHFSDNCDISELEKTVTPPSCRADNTETLVQTYLQSDDFTSVTGRLTESSCSELIDNKMSAVGLGERREVLENSNVMSRKADDERSNLLDLPGSGARTVLVKQSSGVHIAASKDVRSTAPERPGDVNCKQQHLPRSCRNHGSPSGVRQLTLKEANADISTKEDRMKKVSTSRRRLSANKENVNPEIGVSPYTAKERAAKKLDFVPPVYDLGVSSHSRSPARSAASDSGIASHQESLWKTPQSSTVRSSKELRKSAVTTTEAFNCSSPVAIGDCGCTLQENEHLEKLVVAADDSLISGSLNHASMGRFCSSSRRITNPDKANVAGKYERSSSTPVKDLLESKCRSVTDKYEPMNADICALDTLSSKKVPEMQQCIGLSGCSISSQACHLSTGSLSESSFSDMDLTYESTVQLSLPPCLSQQMGNLQKDVRKETSLAAVSTQTSVLFDDDRSHPVHKGSALAKQETTETDGKFLHLLIKFATADNA